MNGKLVDTISETLMTAGISLIDPLPGSVSHKLSEDLMKLQVNDHIQLTCETDPGMNGLYEIISHGSVNEPWVIKKFIKSNIGTTNNGTTNNGTINNGMTYNGTTYNGTTNNGTTNIGTTNIGTTNIGTMESFKNLFSAYKFFL